MPSQQELTSWQAADREELVRIWRDLVGDAPDHQPIILGEVISPSGAGYVFQTWIVEAFRLSHAEIEPPFRIPLNPGVDGRVRHEVDGLFIHGWTAFLIESKFQHVDFGPIARLHVLTEGCPIGTMGLLFAAKGFTSPALEAIQLLRPIRVLLFDTKDIETVLRTEELDFTQAVRLKWKAAIMFGSPSYSLTRLLNMGADK